MANITDPFQNPFQGTLSEDNTTEIMPDASESLTTATALPDGWIAPENATSPTTQPEKTSPNTDPFASSSPTEYTVRHPFEDDDTDDQPESWDEIYPLVEIAQNEDEDLMLFLMAQPSPPLFPYLDLFSEDIPIFMRTPDEAIPIIGLPDDIVPKLQSLQKIDVAEMDDSGVRRVYETAILAGVLDSFS